MEKRKARIDTDVMERFVPSCRRCVNSDSDGRGIYFCRRRPMGIYWAVIICTAMKKVCVHYKRKV